MELFKPKNVTVRLIGENGNFPNNSQLPLLIYEGCFRGEEVNEIEELVAENQWKNIWVNGIFPFHHYHSNTHEVLAVSSGFCDVQVGGEGGEIFKIKEGDLLLLPAGVAHKNVSCARGFVCVGAYPMELPYDMNYGKSEERRAAIERIKEAPLPKTDPLYGEEGPLFQFWKIS
jgi:uncharacterized protein YjlB